MPEFQLVSDFRPQGDQPQAIAQLIAGLKAGHVHQTLLGATGTGKTYVMAQLVAQWQRPTLVIAHNKTLAAQLAAEFKAFFPNNAVEYFVSYYDYYQPEAYVPSRDTYIEKDSTINDEIDKLRHSATFALFERRDVLVVASVSCIYGLGSPDDYRTLVLSLRKGMVKNRQEILRRLVDIQYNRNDIDFQRGTFRVRGDTLDIFPAGSTDRGVRVEMFGNEIERLTEFDALTGQSIAELNHVAVYPARHYVVTDEKMQRAVCDIENELNDRLKVLRDNGKILEAYRLEQRTRQDLDMLREVGYCPGIENYSRHLQQREPGSPPWTLMDYFPPDYLLILDESHMSVPQVRGMYNGDRSRKNVLVDYGFRLPSAMDNRPLTFEEFEHHINQALYTSAPPGPYELQKSQQVVQQIIRPTGIVDPQIIVRPAQGQVDDLVGEVKARVARKERVLVTTLTKRMAEDLTDYLLENGFKVRYLHSEVDTLERIQIVRDLRLGEFDVLVGINLLREGLDLPEVTLVAILDADKEGFLRGQTSLIQTIGRAARNVRGKVIMYADRRTEAMRVAIQETDRRRARQTAYNEAHGITPRSIVKGVSDIAQMVSDAAAVPIKGRRAAKAVAKKMAMPRADLEKLLASLEAEMFEAADQLKFEYAAKLRDEIKELSKELARRERSVG